MSCFFALISRMKYINRWALMRNISAESLSVHSHETAVIAHALCTIGNRRLNKSYNADLAATLALYHDASEIITGDMPTPVKYLNSTIKHAYKNVEKDACARLLSCLPEDLRQDYHEILEPEDTQLLKIIKAADKLSALVKCMEEQKLGNSEFKKAQAAQLKAIKALECEEADIFMDEFIPAYSLSLDELGL